MHKSGFTLIEMSIVLVIIGLIIGGILVGRDLISASEVRAQIAQIEKYNSAVNTFKNKYGGIPGDLMPTLVSQFGFAQGANCNGSQPSQRNGDGLLDGANPFFWEQTIGEVALFWVDLSTANLIDSQFPNNGAAPVTCNGGSTPVLSLTPGTLYVGDYYPVAKISHGTFVYVYETSGNNWYGLSAITSTQSNGNMLSTPSIPVIQAYNIDKKVDDSIPTSGTVKAVYLSSEAITNAPNGATDTTTTCYSGTAPNFAYSLSATANQGAGLNCGLSFRFQ